MGSRVVLATKAAALPTTLGGRDLMHGNAVSQLGGALFQLAGAGVAFVATFLVLPVGPVAVAGAGVYLLGAASALAIARAGEPRAATTLGQEILRVMREIGAGLTEVSRTPKAGAAISTYFWLRLLWSYSLVGILFVLRDLLAGDDLAVTVLTGGAGAAGAASGFVVAQKVTERVATTANVVLAASSVAGVGVAVLGAIEQQITIALLAFFLGFGFFLAKISLDTMVQEALGDDFRGRAFSLYDIAYNMAWVVAAGIMKMLWTGDNGGLLISGMGIAFMIGMALLALWYRRSGLLVAPPAAS